MSSLPKHTVHSPIIAIVGVLMLGAGGGIRTLAVTPTRGMDDESLCHESTPRARESSLLAVTCDSTVVNLLFCGAFVVTIALIHANLPTSTLTIEHLGVSQT